MFPKEIQTLISTYQFFGFIPLDKTLHFLVGAIITIGLRWRGISIWKTMGILAIIETIKEIIDSKTLQSSMGERILDFLVTFIYPTILLIVIETRKKLLRRIREQEELEEKEKLK